MDWSGLVLKELRGVEGKLRGGFSGCFHLEFEFLGFFVVRCGFVLLLIFFVFKIKVAVEF